MRVTPDTQPLLLDGTGNEPCPSPCLQLHVRGGEPFGVSGGKHLFA